MNAEEIINLSENWLKSVIPRDGTITINLGDKSFRLRSHGIVVHELDFERLIACIISTSITLAIPNHTGGNAPNMTMVDQDHRNIWGWCAEYVNFLRIHSKPYFVSPLVDLFLTCSQAACMPVVHKNGFITDYLKNSHLHLSYLAMPLLEGVAKIFCEEFVDIDGKVKKPFRKLSTGEYKVNGRCSNIGDLLLLVESTADDDLKQVIIRLNRIVESYNPGCKAYKTIKNWRNSSLHGSENYSTVAGITFNYALVIILNKIKMNYEENRLDCIDHLDYLAEMDGRDEYMYIPQDYR
ncbi:TPA: hypothetical protein J0549_001714 [Escherichia coli]|nr:hypothetical protein [Escherichia coli]